MSASWREHANYHALHMKWLDDTSTKVTAMSDTRTRFSIARTSTVAVASFAWPPHLQCPLQARKSFQVLPVARLARQRRRTRQRR